MTQVFISYSRTDIEFVQRLATDLEHEGFDVWWDLTDIQGSDVWERKIEEGLRNCKYFIVVLTPASLESRWVRREYLSADNAGIKIIPLKLKSYGETPLTLRDIQPVDAIERRYENVLSDVLRTLKGVDAKVGGAVSIPKKGVWNQIVELLLAKGTREVDVGGTFPLVAYFLLASFELLGPGDDAITVLVAASAALAGVFFLIRKTIPRTNVFRILGIIYLLVYGLVNYSDYFGLGIPFISILAGIAALSSAGVLLVTIQRPKKAIYFSSFSFALFLFIVSANMYSNYVGDYDSLKEMPIMITSVITSILLWMDL